MSVWKIAGVQACLPIYLGHKIYTDEYKDRQEAVTVPYTNFQIMYTFWFRPSFPTIIC